MLILHCCTFYLKILSPHSCPSNRNLTLCLASFIFGKYTPQKGKYAQLI